MSEWKPIADFTDQDYDLGLYESRVVLSNSCNGPHHLCGLLDGYYSADEIKQEGVWELFYLLPPLPTTPTL